MNLKIILWRRPSCRAFHTLAGLPGAKLSDISRVYSKTEALMQTSRFLDDHPDWQRISVVNTAVAAKKALEENDISQAAVCSAYAADVHGLSVLVDGINDDADNSTRFIVVTNQKVYLKDASRSASALNCRTGAVRCTGSCHTLSTMI